MKKKQQVLSSIRGASDKPMKPFLASKFPKRDYRGETIKNGKKVRV